MVRLLIVDLQLLVVLQRIMLLSANQQATSVTRIEDLQAHREVQEDENQTQDAIQQVVVVRQVELQSLVHHVENQVL